MLGSIYHEWNSRLNLISRKDIGHLYLRHVLHSLSIAKCIQFPPQSTILDAGTGGGFPGIPLAIMFPHARFTLADSIGKKIIAIRDIAAQLGLQNVDIQHSRIEKLPCKYDYAVCRAVAPLPVLHRWLCGKITKSAFVLKGGDVSAEISMQKCKILRIYDTEWWFEEPFFEKKMVIVLSLA